jgi:hypothetical protein
MQNQLNLNRKPTNKNLKASATLCSEGVGWGRKHGDAHPRMIALSYDDPTRGLRRVKITREDSIKSYNCRKCGTYQGCAFCLADIASIVCKDCGDWANDLSERVHGRMVKDKELARTGFKLVAMVSAGQIDFEGFTKLWNEARGAVKPLTAVAQLRNFL